MSNLKILRDKKSFEFTSLDSVQLEKYMHFSFSDEAPDTADDSDEDLITSYIPGVGMNNKPGHPIIRIGSPTAGNGILSDDRPILGEY